jgi:hypothetical protein
MQMRRLPQNLSVLAVSILTVSSLAVAPVFAEHGLSSGSGRDATTSTSTTTTSSTSGPSTKTDDSTVKTETETETETEATDTTADDSGHHGVVLKTSGDLRAEAAKLLSTQRQDQKKVSSVADRQKACTARQAELTTREANFARNAQKHLDTFNSIYTKVLAFQTSHNLTSTDFAALKATADGAKADAATAVAALSSADVKIDCTASDPAVAVANLKTAVSNARTALQNYRTAVKNVVVALQKANDNSSSSTSTSTDDSGNNTTAGN